MIFGSLIILIIFCRHSRDNYGLIPPMLSGLAAFASQVFCTSAMFSCSRSLGRELSGVFSARPCTLVCVREPDTSSPGAPPTRNQS